MVIFDITMSQKKLFLMLILLGVDFKFLFSHSNVVLTKLVDVIDRARFEMKLALTEISFDLAAHF